MVKKVCLTFEVNDRFDKIVSHFTIIILQISFLLLQLLPDLVVC